MISCDNCKFGTRKYADGYIHKDWSGRFDGNVKDLPKVPDNSKYWTYLECSKNNKGLKHVNLSGDCKVFVVK